MQTPDKKISDWQNVLARSLPAGATLQDRIVLLTDTQGRIQASAPLSVEAVGKPLLKILGNGTADDHLRCKGGCARAYPDRRRESARNRAQPGRVLVPGRHHAANGIERCRRGTEMPFVDMTLSLTSGFLLLLIGAAFRSSSDKNARTEATATAYRGKTETALREAGVALWDWNIARGTIHWTGSKGLMPDIPESPHSISFREIAKTLHPDDNLYGIADKALRENSSNLNTTVRMRTGTEGWTTLRVDGVFKRESEQQELHLIALVSRNDLARAPRADQQSDPTLHDAIEAISEAFVLWDNENNLVMVEQQVS